MNKKIFISTGEVSGDLHGSLLSKALLEEAKKKSIDLEICGLGGERMKKDCLLYTSPSPRDSDQSRMPSSA